MDPSMLFKFFVKHNYHDRYIREHNCVYEPQIVAYIFYGCKLERNYYDEYSNISYTWYIPKKVVTESLPLLILKHADKSLLLNCSGVDEWRIHQIQTSA